MFRGQNVDQVDAEVIAFGSAGEFVVGFIEAVSCILLNGTTTSVVRQPVGWACVGNVSLTCQTRVGPSRPNYWLLMESSPFCWLFWTQSSWSSPRERRYQLDPVTAVDSSRRITEAEWAAREVWVMNSKKTVFLIRSRQILVPCFDQPSLVKEQGKYLLRIDSKFM